MTTAISQPPAKPTTIPPLRDGDRLTEPEFWRRYEASPEGIRAELIFGVVHLKRWIETDDFGEERLMPPIAGGRHGRPQAAVIHWIETYSIHTPGTEGQAPATIRRVTPTSSPEPDALLRVLPDHGGRTADDDAGYVVNGPELVVEIANTSGAYDLGAKLDAYQAGGVPEYLVWRTGDRVIDWFRLNRTGRYVPIAPDGDGLLKSRVFPGLWLDPEAMVSSNRLRVLEVVQQGIASPEHAAFVAKLARKKR